MNPGCRVWNSTRVVRRSLAEGELPGAGHRDRAVPDQPHRILGLELPRLLKGDELVEGRKVHRSAVGDWLGEDDHADVVSSVKAVTTPLTFSR
jgi:hypothetical protein